jgi:hypothetical protein
MKKIYRISQLHRIAGKQISGLRMYRYGLPYDGAVGAIYAKKKDLVDLMHLALEQHPELHIVTHFHDGSAVNRYEEKNALAYFLHLGNADPEIEFSRQWSADDFTDEEWQRHYEQNEKFLNSERTPQEIAAVNWALSKILRA